MTRRLRLGDTINDLYVYSSFGPFDAETAHAFLGRLSASYAIPLDEDVKARICERTGWLIPFHLQLCFSELRTHCHGRPPVAADVDAVYVQAKLAEGDRLKYLLDVLCSDGYVIEQQGRFLFRSSSLRDFWRRHIA